MGAPIQIVRGITMTPEGEVTIEEELQETLLDLSEGLESRTSFPVDVEHVVAALVFASRLGHVTPLRTLRADDAELLTLLEPHLRVVFDRYGGEICDDDQD
jgi:hypothetical protein